MNREIYLDYNATSPLRRGVLEAMLPFLSSQFGNPSSVHGMGEQARRAVQDGREHVAKLIGCRSAEVVFTSCGTESINTVIRAVLAARTERRHIVTTAIEHPASLQCLKALGSRCEVTILPVDSRGRIDLDQLSDAISEQTALVNVMMANNEVGNLNPLETIAELAHAKGALLHTDAVQAAGKVPLNARKHAIDYLSLSGHKLGAPKGVGALMIRRGAPFVPLLWGGNQESARRSGTENVASIVGFGAAASGALADLERGEAHRIAALRDRLEAGVIQSIPDVVVNGDPSNRLPNTTNMGFQHASGEVVLQLLDELGIQASASSACHSGAIEPSHVLAAMRVPDQFIHSSVRFSLGPEVTEDDIDVVLNALPRLVAKARETSVF